MMNRAAPNSHQGKVGCPLLDAIIAGMSPSPAAMSAISIGRILPVAHQQLMVSGRSWLSVSRPTAAAARSVASAMSTAVS